MLSFQGFRHFGMHTWKTTTQQQKRVVVSVLCFEATGKFCGDFDDSRLDSRITA